MCVYVCAYVCVCYVYACICVACVYAVMCVCAYVRTRLPARYQSLLFTGSSLLVVCLRLAHMCLGVVCYIHSFVCYAVHLFYFISCFFAHKRKKSKGHGGSYLCVCVCVWCDCCVCMYVACCVVVLICCTQRSKWTTVSWWTARLWRTPLNRMELAGRYRIQQTPRSSPEHRLLPILP